jgi:hypothetical protein
MYLKRGAEFLDWTVPQMGHTAVREGIMRRGSEIKERVE